jgi:hypothetical protein
MPIIPATCEVEIGKILIQSLPGQKVSNTPSQHINRAWWFVSLIPDSQETVGRRILVQDQPK